MKQAKLDLSHLLPVNKEIAAKIASAASHYECTMTLEHGNAILNLKSMLGLLSQMMPKDGQVSVTADGLDEDAAIAEMEALIHRLSC